VPSSDETVAVVVVMYNSAELLADLIVSLGPGLAGLRWQLILVDNASTDNSVAVASRFAPDSVIVQTGRNSGYAAGINAGVAAAGPHSCVLVLNPDVRLEPGCVAELLNALRIPGTGIAVPRLVDRNGVRIDTLRREPSVLRVLADAILGARRAGSIAQLGEVVTLESAYSAPTITDWAEGSTQLISVECWLACRGWDESFFLYSEETDFALRAGDAGFAVRYWPAAQAVHLEGDSGESPALWPLLTLNRVKLYRKRHGSAATALFWAAVVLREGSRAAIGKAKSRAALRALLDPLRLREPRGPHSVRI
jgi:N-acetylglucosaminyl-diphospho-decaprenol L-rhamnosyltransferase